MAVRYNLKQKIGCGLYLMFGAVILMMLAVNWMGGILEEGPTIRVQRFLTRIDRKHRTGSLVKAVPFTGFANSMFCPIVSNRDQEKYGESLEYIYDLQFASSEQENPKYLMQPWEIGWGEGSRLQGQADAFALAMAMERTFLLDTFDHWTQYNSTTMTGWKWVPKENGRGQDLCEGRLGRDCVLHQVSAHNVTEILERYSSPEERFYFNSTHYKDLQYGNMTMEKLKEKLDPFPLVINQCRDEVGCGRVLLHLWTEQKPEWGLNNTQISALGSSFLMRMRENVRREMDDKVRDVLQHRNQWNGGSKTIGLPIRGSDKCKRVEMQCLEWDVYPEIVSSPKADHPEIDSMIITSEEAAIIEWTKQNLKIPGIQAIYNHYDDLPGTSTMRGTSVCASNDTSCIGSWVNQWLTTRVQMNARYRVGNAGSNTNRLIMVWTEAFDCELDQDPHTEVQGEVISTGPARGVRTPTHRNWTTMSNPGGQLVF